jgi:hypothetical protein
VVRDLTGAYHVFGALGAINHALDLTNLNSANYTHLTAAHHTTLTAAAIADALHHHAGLWESDNGAQAVWVDAAGNVGVGISVPIAFATHKYVTISNSGLAGGVTGLYLQNVNAAAHCKNWVWLTNGNNLELQLVADNFSSSYVAIKIERSGVGADVMRLAAGLIATGSRIEDTEDIAIVSDYKNLELGAGGDVLLYYDGTIAHINAGVVNPSDLNIDCGGAGATVKTIVLAKPVYEDMQVSISNIRVPASNAPTERLTALGIGSGVTFPVLGFATGNYMYFDIQTAHAMKLSTILDNHIHWTAHASFTPGHEFAFRLDVVAAAVDGTWAVPAGSPYTSADNVEAANDHTKHKVLEIADITAVNTTPSTIYKCKLTRVAPATGTDEAQEIYIHFNDGHYQKDTMGSRQETVK